MTKVVVLHSGGLDSTLMYELAKSDPDNEVIPVYFDIGHEYAYKEKQCLPKDTIIHDMTWFQAEGVSKEGNSMSSIFIPGRNMMFITLAACKYIPDEIWLGALMGEIHESATDKNLEFLRKQNDVLGYTLSPFGKVKVRFPFIEKRWGKLELTRWGVDQGFSSMIEKSSSCMSGEKGSCGRCGVCIRRAGIFPQLGLEETFNTDVWEAPENRKYIADILKAAINNDPTHYDSYRTSEIIPTLQEKYPGLALTEILDIYQ